MFLCVMHARRHTYIVPYMYCTPTEWMYAMEQLIKIIILHHSPRWYSTQQSCDVVVSNPPNKNVNISSWTSISDIEYLDSASCAFNNNVSKSFLSSSSSFLLRLLIICSTRLSSSLRCWRAWNALKGCIQVHNLGSAKNATSPACSKNDVTAYRDRKINHTAICLDKNVAHDNYSFLVQTICHYYWTFYIPKVIWPWLKRGPFWKSEHQLCTGKMTPINDARKDTSNLDLMMQCTLLHWT